MHHMRSNNNQDPQSAGTDVTLGEVQPVQPVQPVRTDAIDAIALSLFEALPADRHPAAVYLARLAPG